MIYQTFTPPRHLRPYLKKYSWQQVSKEEKALHFPEGRLRLPDLSTSMGIHLSERRHWRVKPGGRAELLPVFNARGYYKEPILYNTDVGVDLLIIDFTPLGLSALLGGACEELNNYTVNAGLFFPKEIARMEDLLLTEGEIGSKIDCLNRFFSRRIRPMGGIRRAARLLGAIEHYEGYLSVHDLADELCMCERSLNRFFHTYVGMSPKLYLRVSRFRKALDQIRLGHDKSWSDISFQTRYYDQAHFINEIKSFTGMTPTEIREEPSWLLN